MKKLSLLAGFLVIIFLAVPQPAQAGSRFVFSFGIGAPVYAPYPYYVPYPAYYYPPYPAYYAPYPYYAGPVVGYYGGYYRSHGYYGSRGYYRPHNYYRGHVPRGRAYGYYSHGRGARR